ncbi:MAG: hypothetical protein MK102_14950 [Fuerstiella sp.]|nr:hypothetical protein [Fuerstiella sp.]
MCQSAGSGVFFAFGVFLLYLCVLLGRQLLGIQVPMHGVWWLVLAAGLFILGFAASELKRQAIAKRQTGLESIGCIRLTAEESQRLSDQISCLFPVHVNVDPLAKCVISESAQLYFADVQEVVSPPTGDDPGKYRWSTACLIENRRFALPVFELSPVRNPLRVLGRLLRFRSKAGDCRKFGSFYDVDLATDKSLSQTLSLPVRQWLADVSHWDRYPAWTLRANGKQVLLYRHGKVFSVQDFNRLLAKMLVIADTLDVKDRTSHESEHRDVYLEKTAERFPFENEPFPAESYESVLSQSPPRQLLSEWKKLTKVRPFLMALYLLFSVSAAGVVGGELPVPAAVSAVASFGILILIGGSGFVWHVLHPYRARRLLEIGTLVYGHITRFAPTGNYHNDQMKYEIEVRFENDNKQQTARCHVLLSSSHLGAAHFLANSNAEVAILYDQFSPGRIILPQFLAFSH